MIRILEGDCRLVLPTLAAGSVQVCVTSPPYWGLRDYGTGAWEGGEAGCDHSHFLGGNGAASSKQVSNNGTQKYQYREECGKCGARRIDQQMGLESTPEEYIANMVAVFREVWRVLRDDGTLWLNMGDSYASSGTVNNDLVTSSNLSRHGANGFNPKMVGQTKRRAPTPTGLKPKDLCMMPARVAMALQAPWYSGSIKDERDRIWLAAMLDAEGCMFIHRRKEGQHNGQGYFRQNDNFGPGVEISNTHEAIIQRVMSIVGKGSICTQGSEENSRRKQLLYRWNLRTTESKELIRELYPYLVAKRHQARILYGCPPSGEQAKSAHISLIAMHRGLPPVIDFKDPPSCFEPGWYLRSDIIWNKKNPMPESVTDRPTTAHEHIFLLAKQERYYYDNEAIREPQSESTLIQHRGKPTANYEHRSLAGAMTRKDADTKTLVNGEGRFKNGFDRNKRSVWTVATQPYAEAHFATFAEDLIKPCILAGSKPGDTVLDPFAGSGTTGKVALELGRRAILIELNAAYVALAERRTNVTPGMF